MTVKVLVNGFGTIGKRVAWAVTLQDDMQLIGVANRSLNSNIKSMMGAQGPLKGTKIFSMENGAGFDGTLEDALSKADVVVDGMPSGIEEKFKPLYEKYGVKAVYQGGADETIAPVSFNADANYSAAFGKKAVRVVSCNTTSLIRTIHALDKAFGVDEIFASLIRRAVDPADDKKGPVNAAVPETEVPSHHGPDVNTVLPHINISTVAVKVPTTMAHLHTVVGKMKRNVTTEHVVEAFRNANRIALFNAKDGYTSTTALMEHYRDINRPRGDMYEAAVWNDSVKAEGRKVYWMHAVHSEAIVIPDNIDAIRALAGIEKDATKSIAKTNRTLGII